MNKKDVINKTANFVKKKLDNERSGHDWWHVYLVWQLAKKIGKKEKADMFVVELSALLHDIADWKFNNNDESIGAKVATRWLTKLHVEKHIIDQVSYIVGNVSFKGAGVDHTMKTLEGKVVWDSDKMDIGAIGIARTFTYGGYRGRPIYDPKIKPKFHKNFEEYKKSSGPSINHFYEKILLLKDMMQTETGRKMAIRRDKFLRNFLKEFFDEWNGIR
ncbi:MAG: HD domain-containing protein [Candidatus Marsarchaeota archaeon]|nr:HD domain-containing protein [Candidatus Marsarchaeota archaeon]